MSRMSKRVIDLTGKRFGKLTVLGFVRLTKSYQAVWRLLCACGCTRDGVSRHLRNGDLTTCGKCSRPGYERHGQAHKGAASKEYLTWMAMHRRCRVSKFYLDRKIRVCARWRLFSAFYTDMGPAPAGRRYDVSIERRNGHRGYTPVNCVWAATRKVQNRNRTTSRHLRYAGRKQTIAAWAEELKLPYHTLYSRLNRGWTVSSALSTPLQRSVV